MNNKKNTHRASRLNIIITVGLVLMAVAFSPSARAQQTGEPQPDEPLTLEDMYLTPGKLVAEGVDRQASGPLQIKSYKVEEVKLPRPVKLWKNTELQVIENVFRLTVTLGVDRPLQGSYVILLDDELQTAVVTKRNAVSAVYFNSLQLEDGAQISVALGTGCARTFVSTMTSKLRMPEKYKLTRRGDADPGHRVKKIHTVPARAGLRDRDEVEFQLTTPNRLPVTNEALVMQVGDVEVPGGGYVYGDGTIRFRMSLEQFSRAQDGKRIRVKFGRCSGIGLRFGKLNKAQLNQSSETIH